MALSLNQENDDALIEMTKAARLIGAEVELVTTEKNGYPTFVERVITIKYLTHSSTARTLNTPKEKN